MFPSKILRFYHYLHILLYICTVYTHENIERKNENEEQCYILDPRLQAVKLELRERSIT